MVYAQFIKYQIEIYSSHKFESLHLLASYKITTSSTSVTPLSRIIEVIAFPRAIIK